LRDEFAFKPISRKESIDLWVFAFLHRKPSRNSKVQTLPFDAFPTLISSSSLWQYYCVLEVTFCREQAHLKHTNAIRTRTVSMLGMDQLKIKYPTGVISIPEIRLNRLLNCVVNTDLTYQSRSQETGHS